MSHLLFEVLCLFYLLALQDLNCLLKLLNSPIFYVELVTALKDWLVDLCMGFGILDSIHSISQAQGLVYHMFKSA